MMRSKWLVILAICWLFWYWGWADDYMRYNVFYRVAYQSTIFHYAKENRLDPHLVAAVIYTESRFQSNAKSDRGAIGLMQLMPETAQWIAAQHGSSVIKLETPEENIRIGTWYLRYLLDEYDSTVLALAAYNAGRGHVDEWIEKYRWKENGFTIDDIPFGETREFVRNVLRYQSAYQSTDS